jgi:hypothetical protein
VRAGLALAKPESVKAGGRTLALVRMVITDAACACRHVAGRGRMKARSVTAPGSLNRHPVVPRAIQL